MGATCRATDALKPRKGCWPTRAPYLLSGHTCNCPSLVLAGTMSHHSLCGGSSSDCR